MVDLAERASQGPIQIRDIAERQSIPQHYLEQILVILKKGGLVQSFRGAQGGYALAKAADSIGVLDILEQLEGSLNVVPHGKRDAGLQFFWQGLEACIANHIDIQLSDLVMKKNERSFSYSI